MSKIKHIQVMGSDGLYPSLMDTNLEFIPFLEKEKHYYFPLLLLLTITGYNE